MTKPLQLSLSLSVSRLRGMTSSFTCLLSLTIHSDIWLIIFICRSGQPSSCGKYTTLTIPLCLCHESNQTSLVNSYAFTDAGTADAQITWSGSGWVGGAWARVKTENRISIPYPYILRLLLHPYQPCIILVAYIVLFLFVQKLFNMLNAYSYISYILFAEASVEI